METATFDISTTVRQAQNGDTAAFAVIVRQYQSLVSGVLYSMTGDFHRSEDLAQETFLIAWNKLADLRAEENVAAWLCAIARNLANRSFRKKTVDTVHGSLGSDSLNVASADAKPDAELQRREQSELVWSALEEIPEPYRETLVLFYRSGQSIRDIAEATQTSESAVKQKLYRARQSLRSKIEEMIGDILTDTAPGDVFTFGVMAAVTGSTFLTTGQTVLAASATTGASVAGTTSGTAGKSIGATTFWSVLGPLAYLVWMLLIIWNSCYLSVRNAPTLRARRFRLQMQFRSFQFAGLFIVAALALSALFMYLIPESEAATENEDTLFTLLVFVATFWLLVMPIFALVEKRYKKIVEFNLGLSNEPGPSPTVADIYRQFHRALFVNALWAETLIVFILYTALFERYGMVYSWGESWRFHLIAMLTVMVAAISLFFLACYRLGEHLIGLSLSEESMKTTPPVVDDPFEIALGTVEKSTLSVDRREGNVFWISAVAWFALAVAMLWFLVSFVNWHVAPVTTGMCVVLFIVTGFCQSRWIPKIKDRKRRLGFNALIFFIDAVLSLLFLAFQSRSGSPVELWHVLWTGYDNMVVRQAFGSVAFMFLFLGMYSLLRSLLEKTEEPEFEQRRKEAIVNYRPSLVDRDAVFIPTGFPMWMRITGTLYGVFILGFVIWQLIFPNPMVAVNVLLSKGDYDTLIQMEPNNGDYYARRAFGRLRTNPEGAMGDLNTALRLNPDNEWAYRDRAKLLLGLDYVGSIWDGREKTNEKPLPSPLDVRQALADTNDAIRCHPKYHEIWMVRARAHELLDDYDAAIADMRQAMRRYKSPIRAFERRSMGQMVDERAYMHLAIVTFLEKKGDLKKAVEECTKALRWLDEDASSRSFFTDDFLRRRAELYEKLGEPDKAKADLEKAP